MQGNNKEIRRIDNNSKAAFALVKEEILQLKRAKNKQFLEMQNLKDMFGKLTTKNEFYDKVNYLNNCIEKFLTKDEIEFMLKSLRLQLSTINSNIEVLDGAIKQLYGLKKLDGELNKLDSKKVEHKEFYKFVTGLQAELERLNKRTMGLEAEYKKLDKAKKYRYKKQ